MKVLIVCSKNSGTIAPFIVEQVDALNKEGIVTDYFTIQNKGWQGYLNSRKLLLEKIKVFNPDIVHAHYGFSGLLANLQRKIPVITTYHGSDINQNNAFKFSLISIWLSKHNIFVSEKNFRKSKVRNNYSLIPCGINTELFVPMKQTVCRETLKLTNNSVYVLFAGAFDNKVKNAKLAQTVVAGMGNVKLLEFKGYSRKDAVTLMNAVDLCLMTSFTEGSPQFIKEAMACNCPIVSVDVGDVKETIINTNGCFLAKFSPDDVEDKINKAIAFAKRTNGRDSILKYDNALIAKRIIHIYQKCLKQPCSP